MGFDPDNRTWPGNKRGPIAFSPGQVDARAGGGCKLAENDPPDDLGSRLVAALPQMRRYALAVSRQGDLADELVQDACERALASAGPGDPATPLLPWLFTIIRNRWVDRQRRARTEGVSIDIDEHPDLAFCAGEDERVDTRQTLARVQEAIDRLGPEQRELLLLVCVEQLSYKEAAGVTGVPIGTVMSRLARARLRVAEGAGLAPGPGAMLR